MNCAIFLVAVALFASPSDGLPKNVYPRFNRRCCAEASQCFHPTPWDKPPCSSVDKPFCNTKYWWYKRCDQDLILLNKVWTRFSNGKYRCCGVLNCPKIYYSRCSYTVEKCEGVHRACAPHYYRRYRLKLMCPGVGIRYTWRYFPRCCVCQYCGAPRFFQTLPGNPRK